jgi:aminoglycoside phosphotransferase (APT) family kinase protein
MCARKMHADEVDTDVSLVGRMLAAQFPNWADLPIEPVLSIGTDNAIYRLGADMCVRLPRIHWAVGQVDKEHEWLRILGPHLPLAIPVPLAKGMPAEGYPWRWSVCRWLEGEVATIERIADARQAARDLAQFITALHRIDPIGGPSPGAHNSHRGVPLAMRDSATRTAIASLEGMIDTEAAAAAWEGSLKTAPWERPPVWIHGDMMPGNLLINQGGRLSAVIDFGCLGVERRSRLDPRRPAIWKSVGPAWASQRCHRLWMSGRRRSRMRHDGRLDALLRRKPRAIPRRTISR